MDRNRKKLRLPLTSEGVFSPSFSQTQSSPMTALSACMGELSCFGSTPKRRLSMSSIGETPPARPLFHGTSPHSSGGSVHTHSPSESPFPAEQFHPILLQQDRPASSRHSFKFQRFNSMPVRLHHHDTPSSSPFPPFGPIESGQGAQGPREGSEGSEHEGEERESGGIWMHPVGESRGEERRERTAASRISLLDLPSPSEAEEDAGSTKSSPSGAFMFRIPTGKPLSARVVPSDAQAFSFSAINSNRPTSAPATLVSLEDEDIELRHDSLASSNDDEDDVKDNDGFSDIFDADTQETAPGFSASFASLIHGDLVKPHTTASPSRRMSFEGIPHSGLDCNAITTTPSAMPKCRKGIFKVPSQPAIVRRNSSLLKRAERPRDTPSPVQNKRPRSSTIASPQTPHTELHKDAPSSRKLFRSLSMMSPNDPYFQSIDHALSVEGSQTELIGDRTKSCCLPTVCGKQKDLKSITPETMCQLLRSEFSDEIGEYYIIDCRYPYEYAGGHIQGAINIYQEEEIKKMFLDHPLPPLTTRKRRIFIFHCEFSSHRGPRLLRYLRKHDRSANLENYPALFYPELYLLNEGYKAFYHYSTEFCEPKSYIPMDHEAHTSELRSFRAKSKSGGEKSRLKRSQSVL
ncbi:M-phase inducer phosphatase 1-B-like [Diadema antillarum]|uniref:M-phase inducer phosphatase 1-B-like n=1 Tax=Diadema antillarum TaxID=105358 RepID=UPI003A86F398